MVALKIVLAFLTVVVLVLMFGQGGYCSAECETVSFTQRSTGATFKGQPEFEVSIINDKCHCQQDSVGYTSTDFNSVEPVDPAIFRKFSGNQYAVNNLQPLPRPPKPPLKFKYAQTRQATFKLTSLAVACN